MTDRAFLDWPFFDEEHRRFANDLKSWLAAHSLEDSTDPNAAVRRNVRALGEAGWLRAVVPAAFGGLRESLDVRTVALGRDELARHAALADLAFAMQGLGSAPITLFGSSELQRTYLPAVARGEAIAAFALSEREAGSDVAALATTARRDGGDYVLSGEKTWITNGGLADWYVVFARTGESGSKGISAFVVSAETKGFEIIERIVTISPHPLATIALKECRVPASRRIGAEGDGFKVAMSTLDLFRSTVGAAALGLARRALDETIAHVTSRHLFGAPLSALQLTQAAVAHMATDIDASALLVYRAAWAKDTGARRVTREAAMAKWFATEAGARTVDRAVQLFGGRGVKHGEIVEKLYRDIRALRIYEGASEIQQILIARQVLERGA